MGTGAGTASGQVSFQLCGAAGGCIQVLGSGVA